MAGSRLLLMLRGARLAEGPTARRLLVRRIGALLILLTVVAFRTRCGAAAPPA